MDFKTMVETARGTSSFTELADRLGVSASNLTAAANGRRPMPETPCARLAVILGMDYGTVRKAHNEAHAKTEEERKLWKKVAGVAAVCLLSGAALPPQAEASNEWRRGWDTLPAKRYYGKSYTYTLAHPRCCTTILYHSSTFKKIVGAGIQWSQSDSRMFKAA